MQKSQKKSSKIKIKKFLKILNTQNNRNIEKIANITKKSKQKITVNPSDGEQLHPEDHFQCDETGKRGRQFVAVSASLNLKKNLNWKKFKCFLKIIIKKYLKIKKPGWRRTATKRRPPNRPTGPARSGDSNATSVRPTRPPATRGRSARGCTGDE